MPAKTRIVGDNGRQLRISDEGQAEVVVHPHPPRNEDVGGQPVPFRQYFTDDGTSGGSNDMAVNGSTNAVPFYVSALQDYDLYIKQISVNISDTGSPNLTKFANLSALTNGVSWSWFTQSEGDYTLHEGIKTNREFMRLGTASSLFGDGANAFLADVSGGGTEKAYLPLIDIAPQFGMPWGLRLLKGSTDRIEFKVNDNLSTIAGSFNIIAYGMRF